MSSSSQPGRADYQPDKDDMGIEDHTIYLINELGQYEILNEDLSGLEDVDEIKEVPTELDAIVHHIQLLCEEQEIPPVPQPWLPPLKERITLDELEEVQPTVAWGQEKPLSVLLGMADPAGPEAGSCLYQSLQGWSYPPLRKSGYRKDHLPSDCWYGLGSNSVPRPLPYT